MMCIYIYKYIMYIRYVYVYKLYTYIYIYVYLHVMYTYIYIYTHYIATLEYANMVVALQCFMGARNVNVSSSESRCSGGSRRRHATTRCCPTRPCRA